MMFPIMLECGDQLQNFLKKTAETGVTIELKDVLACYTTDIISSCAFGIQTNSLKNPDGEFRRYGKKIFEVSVYQAIVNIVLFMFPTFSKFLPVSTSVFLYSRINCEITLGRDFKIVSFADRGGFPFVKHAKSFLGNT